MLRVYGVEGCGSCEVTKTFLTSKNVPFEFVNVTSAPDKRQELEAKLGSPTGGVILKDGDRLEIMQGVSVANLSCWLGDYRTRHPVTVQR